MKNIDQEKMNSLARIAVGVAVGSVILIFFAAILYFLLSIDLVRQSASAISIPLDPTYRQGILLLVLVGLLFGVEKIK